jgi:glycosyltransferase A (GT-A) superfamily protein (DUF2064 family)
VHVTVIAKEPRPGHVKTRLCPPCTPTEAADVAAAALGDTLDAVDRLHAERARRDGRDGSDQPDGPFRRVLLFDGDATRWRRAGWQVHDQRGDGLGERLANGFDDLGPGVIVGMESPHVVAELHRAIDAVRHGEDAIGLAADGGYWVIALGVVERAVFAGVPMSASHTGLAQVRRLHDLGRSVRRLPMARDLDDFDDLMDAATRPGNTERLRTVARAVSASVAARAARPGDGTAGAADAPPG